MGWPPAVVIVVRHGARLDAADKQWHLTSPTPYDPPLTYGGWTQSKALGARIASILRSRETDDDIPGAEGEEPRGDRRKRRHKVIIHTSPFLRCVQTSVAISAGLAQNPGHTYVKRASSTRSSTPTQLHSSPKLPPAILTNSPRLAPIHEPSPSPTKKNGRDSPHPPNIKKSIIRVDAYLGEWLSPDYFEQITPPPSSVMMVAGAKADLLRKEDYSSLLQVTTSNNQGFPGGWGSPVTLPKSTEEDNPFALSSLGEALKRRDRTSSLSSVGSSGSRQSGGKLTSSLNGPLATDQGIYQPPIPNYSISSSDPIPPGYVAHARDACVDVDYQWDSMREPLNWGTGGEYGEEWSAMHKRFRKGLQQMVQWYSFNDEPGKLASKSPPTPPEEPEEADDEDTDLVIVLVTHGAGCNALIGALTAQPVLLDVGMSSLTMAVRRPAAKPTPASTPVPRTRVTSQNINISDEYEVKLVANTEHLRSQSTTPTSSRTPSVSGLSAFRERFVPTGASADTGLKFGQVRSATSAGLGSIRRNNSAAAATPRNYAPARQSSIGLWSSTQSEQDDEEDLGSSMVLSFGEGHPHSPTATTASAAAAVPTEKSVEAPAVVEIEREEVDDVAPLGLWGAPRPPGEAERMREIAPKRRWTVNERA
ncbi:hypothetical protein BP6252_04145 [Coleophoma cylindrospora]|uniref:Phosphoglycerate mutase-like protein n=1 Tax=Coleophoma cylindrospora TaxID=1849047 RepID=A0A3D8RZM7_9HELO|nr:hypothetical protein BP6252_04145 [Coleophoma cylindrospora]